MTVPEQQSKSPKYALVPKNKNLIMINEQAAQRTVLYVWVGWGVGWGVFYLMHAGKPVGGGALYKGKKGPG